MTAPSRIPQVRQRASDPRAAGADARRDGRGAASAGADGERAVAYGTVRIDLYRALTQPASSDHAILFSARLPRVLMGAVVGAVLAAVGAALQALVRNPLAEGGILGISGGGAFGAILALTVGYRLGGPLAIVPLCAFAMALLSTLAVYRLARSTAGWSRSVCC